MTATVEPPLPSVAPDVGERPEKEAPGRAEGVDLLGPVHGSGYHGGAALVRRADGQMVQLGPLMYAVLECVDGGRSGEELTSAVSECLGRRVQREHVDRLLEKLSRQGLIAGSEHRAPPRRNPLLALRWKVLVTDPKLTRRLTAPLAFLFRPWLMVPVLACFVGVFWFVLIHKGVASATAQAFHRPELLLLVFALGVISAGFHELGHAAACRYGGATPGGMGMGLYLVWPAFYTDVTDAYRLRKRDRLRVDLGGLYFNALIAVLTMAVWLVWRADALLLLVALQVLQMVKQLSPVIRADGYHILSDATGVPDLYAHIGPTLRGLLPGRREPTALTGRARFLVSAWTLIVVPVLLSLMLSAVLLFPRLATSAWSSGRHLALAIPHQADRGEIVDLLASVVRLLALSLPVLGSALVTLKVLRTSVGKARSWSQGNPARRAVALLAAAAVVAGLAWAWWPSGQYQPVRANERGTLSGLVQLVSAPAAYARPANAIGAVAPAPGTHLAVSIVPVGGATKAHPALFLIAGKKGQAPVAILSTSSPDPAKASSRAPGGTPGPQSGTGAPVAYPSSAATSATAFPFKLPAAPGRNGNQATALGTKNGGVAYDVVYSLVTVRGGAPVTESNSAYAIAHCARCTTVAVAFQIVLVVGQSNLIAPINAAGALNYECPSCVTAALADQIVVTLKSTPTRSLLAQLEVDLRQLNALSALGGSGTPQEIAAEVGAVQQEVDQQLAASGLLTNAPAATSSTSSGSPSSQSTTGAAPSSTTQGAPPPQQGSSTTPATTVPSNTSQGSPAAPTTSTTTPAPSAPGSSSGTTTGSSAPAATG